MPDRSLDITTAPRSGARILPELADHVRRLWEAEEDIRAELEPARGGEASLSAHLAVLDQRRHNGDHALEQRAGALEEEVATARSGAASLDARIDGVDAARVAADGLVTARVAAEETARVAGDAGLSTRITAETAARETADAGLAGRLTTAEEEQTAARGEAAGHWSAAVAGSPAARAPVSPSEIVVDVDGTVLRVAGAAVRAARGVERIRAGHLIQLVYAARRAVDSADPAATAIECRIWWLSATKAVLATTVATVADLTTGDGLVVRRVFARSTGGMVDGVAAIQPPAGAVYLVAGYQTHGGALTRTDLLLPRVEDLTDQALVSADVSGLGDRLTALETLHLGGRVEALEERTDGSEIARYPSAGVAEAALAALPQTVDVLVVEGHTDPGDGGAGRYVRVPTEPVHPFRIGAAGRWFEGRSVPTLAHFGGREGGSALLAPGNVVAAQRAMDYARERWETQGLRTRVVVPPGEWTFDHVIRPSSGAFLNNHGLLRFVGPPTLGHFIYWAGVQHSGFINGGGGEIDISGIGNTNALAVGGSTDNRYITILNAFIRNCVKSTAEGGGERYGAGGGKPATLQHGARWVRVMGLTAVDCAMALSIEGTSVWDASAIIVHGVHGVRCAEAGIMAWGSLGSPAAPQQFLRHHTAIVDGVILEECGTVPDGAPILLHRATSLWLRARVQNTGPRLRRVVRGTQRYSDIAVNGLIAEIHDVLDVSRPPNPNMGSEPSVGGRIHIGVQIEQAGATGRLVAGDIEMLAGDVEIDYAVQPHLGGTDWDGPSPGGVEWVQPGVIGTGTTVRLRNSARGSGRVVTLERDTPQSRATAMRETRDGLGWRYDAASDRVVMTGVRDLVLTRPDGARLLEGTPGGPLVPGRWDDMPLRLGGRRIWEDAAGVLRTRSGAPSSDTDGRRIVEMRPAGQVSMADNTVTEILVELDRAVVAITAWPTRAAILHLDRIGVGAGPRAMLQPSNPDQWTLTLGAPPTGSSGANGRVNVVLAPDGRVWLENRTGGSLGVVTREMP